MADLEEEVDTEVQSVAEIMANMDEYRTQRTAVRVSSSVRPARREGEWPAVHETRNKTVLAATYARRRRTAKLPPPRPLSLSLSLSINAPTAPSCTSVSHGAASVRWPRVGFRGEGRRTLGWLGGGMCCASRACSSVYATPCGSTRGGAAPAGGAHSSGCSLR
jgi:hypothetical protein